MRVRGLRFIPSSTNFSQLPEGQEDLLTEKNGEDTEFYEEFDKELMLLQSLSRLSSDKERCVLLFEIIRELGFQVDYGSIAHALGIELRWLMRVKASVKNKVRDITVNK